MSVKNNKILFWFLLVAVVGVWGTIAYQIVVSMNSGGEENKKLTNEYQSESLPKVDKYVYNDGVRDPFVFVRSVHKDTTRKFIPKPKIVWTPPPLKLTGIIIAGKKKTLSIEDQNGSVFFLHEGDTLSGVKILKIKDKIVSYLFMKQKSEWVLN
jgi:hypothetical protein